MSDSLDDIANLLIDSEDSGDSGDSDTTIEKKTEPSTEKTVELPEETQPTWGSALGLADDLIQLNEDGDLTGIKVKIDGKESFVTVKDLLVGYQTDRYNTQKSQALSEEARQFAELRNTASQAYTKKLTDADKLLTHLEKSLIKDFSSIDWEKLRAENPGEYAAAVQDYQLKAAELQNVKATIKQELDNEAKSASELQAQNMKTFLESQIAETLKKNPTWSDPAVFKKDMEELQSFAGEVYGFTPEEFQSIYDHRLLELAKDAMKYRKGIAISDKKVTAAPTFQKATQARAGKPSSKLDQLIKTAKDAKGYKKIDAQTDAIAELLTNI